MVTIADVTELLNELAPVELAEPYDNVGLIIGDRDREVTDIIVALDASTLLAAEARHIGAQLIVLHHPVMFSAVKTLLDDDTESRAICEIIRVGAAVYAMHTNFDQVPGGVNDSLVDTLGLEDAQSPEPFLRISAFNGDFGSLCGRVEERLGVRAVWYGDVNSKITRVATACGAGGSEVLSAARLGAEAFITGELKHHELLRARELGMNVIIAGHYATECVAIPGLVRGLQNRADALQYKVTVHQSRVNVLY